MLGERDAHNHGVPQQGSSKMLSCFSSVALLMALTAIPAPPKDRFPFVETFQNNGKTLVYVAATHHWPRLFSDAMADPVFKIIKQIFLTTPPDTVIIEGVDPAVDMGRFLDHAKRCAAAGYDLPNQNCGEPAFTAFLASERNISVSTGEPSTQDAVAFMQSHGYSLEDLLSFYVAREITTRNHGAHISEAEFPRLLANTIAYYARLLGNHVLFTLADFNAWYAKNMRTPRNYLDLTSDDLSPAPQARPPTSQLHRISGTLEILRDQSVVSKIKRAFNIQRRVLVVYGGSHLEYEWNDLVQLLGVPKQSRPF